jgi:hypothetical protein
MKLSLPSATLAALLSSGVVHSTDQNIGLVKTEDAHQTKVDHNMVHEVVCLPSAILAALLSPGVVPSMDQNVCVVPESLLSSSQAAGLAKSAVVEKEFKMQGMNAGEVDEEADKTDAEAKGMKDDIDWNDRSIRLKEKLKARSDLRKTMRSRDVLLVKTKKKCRPTAGFDELGKDALTDVGIFGCVDSHICVEDSASILGGLCARVVEAGSNSTQQLQLQPLTVKDKLKAKLLLDKKKVGAVGPNGVVGEECVPSTSEGFIDVGVLNPCEYSGHVCMKDPSSSLGGTCVGIKVGGSSSPDRKLKEGAVVNRRLTACRYQNGTLGRKCSARSACRGLSEAFIENHIGCGSCVSTY